MSAMHKRDSKYVHVPYDLILLVLLSFCAAKSLDGYGRNTIDTQTE